MGLFGNKPEDPGATYMSEMSTPAPEKSLEVYVGSTGECYTFRTDQLSFDEVAAAVENGLKKLEAIDENGDRIGIVVACISDWCETSS